MTLEEKKKLFYIAKVIQSLLSQFPISLCNEKCFECNNIRNALLCQILYRKLRWVSFMVVLLHQDSHLPCSIINHHCKRFSCLDHIFHSQPPQKHTFSQHFLHVSGEFYQKQKREEGFSVYNWHWDIPEVIVVHNKELLYSKRNLSNNFVSHQQKN